jgi:hypothetical protein
VEDVTSLRSLNLSGTPLSNMACKYLQDLLINKDHLKDLDISNCKVQMQATRSIIWGINKNDGLINFNFSSNMLYSKHYEYSILLAKIITRHQSIMHIDISGTGLKKEEVLFIGMSLKNSKSVVALHLSLNALDYYERIFLRTLTNARVAYHFRNMAAEPRHIRSQKERFQINELKNHDFDDENLEDFVERWNFID